MDRYTAFFTELTVGTVRRTKKDTRRVVVSGIEYFGRKVELSTVTSRNEKAWILFDSEQKAAEYSLAAQSIQNFIALFSRESNFPEEVCGRIIEAQDIDSISDVSMRFGYVQLRNHLPSQYTVSKKKTQLHISSIYEMLRKMMGYSERNVSELPNTWCFFPTVQIYNRVCSEFHHGFLQIRQELSKKQLRKSLKSLHDSVLSAFVLSLDDDFEDLTASVNVLFSAFYAAIDADCPSTIFRTVYKDYVHETIGKAPMIQ